MFMVDFFHYTFYLPFTVVRFSQTGLDQDWIKLTRVNFSLYQLLHSSHLRLSRTYITDSSIELLLLCRNYNSFWHYAATYCLATVDIAEIVAWHQGTQCKINHPNAHFAFWQSSVQGYAVSRTDTTQFKHRGDLFTLMASLQDLLHDFVIVKWLVYWCSLNIDSLAYSGKVQRNLSSVICFYSGWDAALQF